MVDAIGVKLQEASALRAQAPRLASAQGTVEQAESAAAAGAIPGAGGPYYSPIVRLDPETQRTVVLFRDASSGKVQVQYPSERQLEAYRASIRQQQAQEREAAEEGRGGTEPAGNGAAAGGREGAGTHGAAGGPAGAGAAGQPSAGTEAARAPVAVAAPETSSGGTAMTAVTV